MDKNKIKSLLNEGKTESRLANLLEELDAKATKKTDPELKNPELKNSDLFSNAKDEVKEVIVESRKFTAKQKMSFLLEKYGVNSLSELGGDKRSQFLKELNNPNTKFIKPGMLLEATPAEAAKTKLDLAKAKSKNAYAKQVSQNDGPEMLNDEDNTLIKGGKADKLSVEDIAKKHNVSVDVIEKQIAKGVPIEEEHIGKDKARAREICMDHLIEFPDYYDRLIKMEDQGKAGLKEKAESPENDDIKADEKVLEPEIKANDEDVNEKDDKELKDIDKKEGDDTIKTKDQALESVNESMESIFDILRDMSPLQEDDVTGKGEAAVTDNEATKETGGEVVKPDADNKDTFPADEHKQDEEVEEVIVEGELPEALKKNAKDDKDDEDKVPEKLEDGSKDEDHDEESDDDEKDDKKEDDKEEAKDDDKEDLKEAELLPNDANKQVGTKETEKISDTLDSKGNLKPVEELKAVVKDGKVTVPAHDKNETAQDKAEFNAMHEEANISVKGEVAVNGNEATKEEDGKSTQPNATNATSHPAEDHEQKEEIEGIVVEDAVQISDDAVYITIPFNEGEQFAKDLGQKETLIVQEALKVFYGVLNGYNLTESEDIDIPSDSEADIKLYEDKVEIEIAIDNPVEEINEEDATRLQEALDVLNAILKEMSVGGIAQMAQPASVNKELFPDTGANDKDPEKPDQLDNKDVMDGGAKDEVEEVVVESTVKVNGVAIKDVKEVPAGDGKNKKKGFKEEVTVKGDAAMTDNEATKETDGEVAKPDADNDKLFPADEHAEAEETTEVVVESELPDDAQIKAAMEPAEGAPEKDRELEVKDGKVKAKDFDDNKDAEDKAEFNAMHEEVKGGDPEKADKSNDAGSDTLNSKGELDDPKPDLEGKAEPKDVNTGSNGEKDAEDVGVKEVTEAVEYKSLKEAFLLEADYFSKDSVLTVSAEDKKIKLESQLALLVARDSDDPLYEELVRTTILAKKLQEQLQEKYAEVGKTKSEELISLKEASDEEEVEDKEESKDDAPEKSEDKAEDKKEEKSDDKADEKEEKE